jgi:SH3-like domain-containing protein
VSFTSRDNPKLSGESLILLIISAVETNPARTTSEPGTRSALRSVILLCLSLLVVVAAVEASAPKVLPRAKPIAEVETARPVAPPIVATGMPVPRWVTIKAGRVNVRRGPSLDMDVLWTYVRPGLPVEITAEYGPWRRIRDSEGGVGWVKSQMLDGDRNVLITGRVNAAILGFAKSDADAIAFAQPGLIAKLVACHGEWCEISARGYEGFVARDKLWGVHEDERVN